MEGPIPASVSSVEERPSQRSLFDFGADLSNDTEAMLRRTARHMGTGPARSARITPGAWETVYGDEPGLQDTVNKMRYRLDAPKNIWGDAEDRRVAAKDAEEMRRAEGAVAGTIFEAEPFDAVVLAGRRACEEGGGVFTAEEDSDMFPATSMTCRFPEEAGEQRRRAYAFGDACDRSAGRVMAMTQEIRTTNEDGSVSVAFDSAPHVDQCVVVPDGSGPVDVRYGPQVRACESAGGVISVSGDQVSCVATGEDGEMVEQVLS